MALITIHTIVHIAHDVRVTEIVRVIASMATGALEDHVVRGSAQGIRVAIGADAARSVIAMSLGEPSMSKRRPQPPRCVVTCPAGGGDDSSDGGVNGEVIRYRPA